MRSKAMVSRAALLLAIVVLAAPPSARAADVRRATPPVVAASDVADWRAAKLGRAALPKEITAEAGVDAGLLAVTGGALAATATGDAKQDAARAVALIDAAGFDVVNLAHRDLSGDAAALAGAIAAAKAQFVSASFSIQGAPTPWKSHVIIERADKRVAIIGVAARSPLEPFTGLQYTDPRTALQKAIAEAGNVDALVLLADAPLSDVAAWQKEFKEIDAVILSGRGGGAPAIANLPRVLRAPPGGESLGVLSADATKKPFAVALPSPASPSETYKQIAARFAFEPKPPKLAEISPLAPRAPPTSLETNRLTPLGLSAANRAAVATVRSAGIFDAFAGQTAPQGHKYLVLDLSFTNALSPQMVRDRMVPVTYLVPKLSDHLYLVADERRVLRPIEFDAAGMLSTGELKLPRAGSTETGKLIYEIDAKNSPREFVLRMYDYAHGHFVLPVLARGADAPHGPSEQPVAPPAKNEVLEIAAHDVKKLDELDGTQAPPGMTFISLDLRARSQFTYPADATGFDPKARPGQKMQVGTVADWTDAHRYLQLVIDGEYGYAPQPQTTLKAAPRFLPDIMTGGRAIFLAPKQAQAIELRCDFPNAKTPEGKVIHPRGIVLPLQGKRPALARQTKPIAKIDDDLFTITVSNQTTADAFAGQPAEPGKRFIVLDVTVSNRDAKKGEVFQTLEQLKIADAGGQQHAPDPATFAGIYQPAEHVFVPPGERRSFQVSYQLATTETRPRLAFTGFTKAEVLELAALAPGAAPTATRAPAPSAPGITPPPAAVPSPASALAPQMIDVDGKRYPARVPIRPNLQPRGLAGVGLTPEQVNAAIDKGAAGLWAFIKSEDFTNRRVQFGHDREHMLAALALVHSGAHTRFSDFDLQLRKLLSTFNPRESRDTYVVGLYCMLIESYGDPTYLPQLRHAARWLIESQGPEGSWGYGIGVDASLFADQNEAKVLRIAGGEPVGPAAPVAPPMPRITKWERGMDGDTSVSQYALLGLHAASRSRVKPSPELWQRALVAHRKRQYAQDGGWPYHHGSGTYGSMTCAGICALALASHELGLSDPAVVEQIERGLGWLNAHFSVSTHPDGDPDWLHYYLYSVERVGRILDTEFLGEHEWYPLGAQFLLSKQQSDGTWVGSGEEKDPRIAGSFALLFLTRATSSLAETQRSGPGTLKTAVSLPPGRKVYIILDASGSMLAEMDGKPKFEIAREALAALVRELPANAELALRAYGYSKRAIEEGANEDSKLLVPMAPIQKDKLLALLSGLRARGKTPLAYSLEQAARELPQATTDAPLTVLLLTDGGEDTQPRRDPVAAAAGFAKLPHVRVRIVGFDINREDWSQQLQAMAAASGGQYLPAARGDVLLRELRTAVFETPESFVVLDEAQKQVVAGQFGQSVQLPAGKYRIRAAYGGRAFEESFWINPGSTTAVTFESGNVAAAPAAAGSSLAPATPAAADPAPTPQATFCTHCGAALKPATNFCTECGARINR